MQEGKAKGSQLIIYPDGTLYHTGLKRSDNIPRNIFLVGAAERVDTIANYFDSISFKHQDKSRPEFYIKTGTYKRVPMAVMSCGIGVAAIDIALTELYAIWEFDNEKNCWDDKPVRANIIRVGTSGTSLKEIPLGSVAISYYALGLDNLGVFYPPIIPADIIVKDIERKFRKTKIGRLDSSFYVSPSSPRVALALDKAANKFGRSLPMVARGITTASPGFFGPEGRRIGRMETVFDMDEFVKTVKNFQINGLKIINHEMETSILFRLANEILGYQAGAICVVLDNLAIDEVIDAKYARTCLEQCILVALEAMVDLATKT